MSVHVCKQCERRFEYCRACVFKPIYYKDAGYCSRECYKASKNKIKEVVQQDVEVVVIEEDTSAPTEAIEYPYFFTATEEDENEEKEENNTDENKQNYGETVLGE